MSLLAKAAEIVQRAAENNQLLARLAGGERLTDEARNQIKASWRNLGGWFFARLIWDQWSDYELFKNYLEAVRAHNERGGNPLTDFFIPIAATALVAYGAFTVFAPSAVAATPVSAEGATTVGASAAGGAAAATSLAQAASSPVADAAVKGAETAADAVSSIKDSLGGIVGSIKDTIGPIYSAISGTLHDITSTIRDINENLIKPIVAPIKAAMDTFQSLSDVLHRDLSAGLRGILNIPDDIARAFSSLDATMQRSVLMFAQANKLASSEVLGSLLRSKTGAPLGDSSARIATALAPTSEEWRGLARFHFAESIDLESYKTWAAAQQNALDEGASLPAIFFQYFFKLVGVLEGIAAQREPYVELWREEIQKSAGVKKFDPATAQLLYQRGELSREDAIEEMRVQGFGIGRAAALIEATRSLPDTARALGLFARGWIDNVSAQDMLRRQGWSEQDQQLLLNSAYTELDAGSLLELVRRGIVTSDEAGIALQRQGFRQFDAGALLATTWRLLGIADVLALEDRAQIAGAGGGFASLNADPPASFTRYAQSLGVNADAARVLWSNHWRLLSPELMVQAYFRGYVNADQLDVALASASIPLELRSNFIDLQRPLVPFRTISTLMAQGVVSEDQAMDILRTRGFSERDANWLVSIHKGAAKTTSAEHANDLHGLTVATVLKLYDAGTSSREDAAALLAELGLSEHAVEASLTLHDVNAAHAERIAAIDAIVAEAKAGAVERADAESQLAALNLSATEHNKALAKLATALRTGSRLPSDTQLLAMHKNGLLDEQATLDALGLLGYAPGWAQLLIDLETSRAAQPRKSPRAA